MNQGGTTDKIAYSPLTEIQICQGRFILDKTSLIGLDKKEDVFNE